MSLLKNKTSTIFWSFIGIYGIILILNPQLGPTDDFVFLQTLQEGKPLIYWSDSFPYYDWRNLGRFSILTSMEYNLVGLFSNSPFWYFFYHSLQVLLFAFLSVKLIKKCGGSKNLAYLLTTILMLSPAFTISWFRLQLPERNVIIIFILLILTYLKYLEKPSYNLLALNLIIVNLAIYYKETAFIPIAIFAFVRLLYGFFKKDKKTLWLDVFLISSSIIYLFLYFFIIYINSLSFVLKEKASVISILKNTFNFGFFSDPILILILFPLIIRRFYKIIFKKEVFDAIFDPMILSALFYVLAFLVLNMYGTYYLLPAYAFAIPGIVGLHKKEGVNNLFWKITISLTIIVFSLNTIPAGLYYLTYNKYLPINFNKTLDFIIKDTKIRYPNSRPDIFLDGTDLRGGRGTYFIFAEYLNFKGLSFQAFDMKSNVLTSNPEPIFSKIIPPLTVFENDNIYEIKSGDYLIVPPQATTKNIDETYLKSLLKDYVLLFKTESPFAFPNLNLKIIAKYFLSGNPAVAMQNKNLSQATDYYVFLKK